VISIGVFFTLMIAGLSSSLPTAATHGLEAHGVTSAAAHHVAQVPPVSFLFAAFLGYNPIQHLLGPAPLAALSAHNRAAITGSSFFPNLIASPFQSGLHAAFTFAIAACLVAAGASLMRGGRYHHVDESVPSRAPVSAPVPVSPPT
jgi:hypothetical protein